MTNILGIDLAVPSATLLNTEKLSIDSQSFIHIKEYAKKTENLPKKLNVSLSTDESLKSLQKITKKFGSSKCLQHFMIENKNFLDNTSPPSMLYAAIVWLIHNLHESATLILSTLQSLPEWKSSDEVNEHLIFIGKKSGNARNYISLIVVSLKEFKDDILVAHNALSNAFQAEVTLLHLKQERVGYLQVHIENVKKEISELGFFSSKARHKKLEQELASSQEELEDTRMQAEKLRLIIDELESIIDDGAWLKSGLDDIVHFLDNMRKVWTTIGSGLTQLAIDATDAQLENLAFVKQALGLDKAIKQWAAINQAAKQFVVESLQ